MIECEFGGLWVRLHEIDQGIEGDLSMEGGYLDEENDRFSF